MPEPHMTEPRIVSPEEAQAALDYWHEHGRSGGRWGREEDAAHTVATEPDRTRAAVVKALRRAAVDAGMGYATVNRRADMVEDGGDW